MLGLLAVQGTFTLACLDLPCFLPAALLHLRSLLASAR
jgi:hypothetical protein